MLSAKKLRSEVNRLLAEIKTEYETVERDMTALAYGASPHLFLLLGMDKMHTLQMQLRELVGDAATAMIAEELEAKRRQILVDRSQVPATLPVAPSDLLDMPYSPTLLLDGHFDASMTGDTEFPEACEWGFAAFLEDVESGYYDHLTLSDVRAHVRGDMLEVPPFVQVPLVRRVGVVLGWLSALAFIQRDEALVGLGEMLSLIDQLK